jgi:hypothetical protein
MADVNHLVVLLREQGFPQASVETLQAVANNPASALSAEEQLQALLHRDPTMVQFLTHSMTAEQRNRAMRYLRRAAGDKDRAFRMACAELGVAVPHPDAHEPPAPDAPHFEEDEEEEEEEEEAEHNVNTDTA